jgi:hypothetical protein
MCNFNIDDRNHAIYAAVLYTLRLHDSLLAALEAVLGGFSASPGPTPLL